MNEKATIYDYARFCEQYNDCESCPIIEFCFCENTKETISKANEIILKWCKEHPIKTRQSEFLKMFPNAMRFENSNIIAIKPCDVDEDYASIPCVLTCEECFKKYWLAEVEE